MLGRIVGNDALKADLRRALGAGRLAHSILLVGEQGCGAGFAARCLAADYLYPQGGPHAEAVLRGEDSECIALRGEGASGQIPVKGIRAAREAIQHSALSADAAGRVLFIYGAQNLNGSSANAMLKIIEEPPEGALFLLTATSAATVLPTIRSRCATYTLAPVPAQACAGELCRRCPGTSRQTAENLAFLYEGHIGTCLRALQDERFAAVLAAARELCSLAAQGDTYKAYALLAKYEKDREGALLLFGQVAQLGSAAMRRPGFGGLPQNDPQAPRRMIEAAAEARRCTVANGNLRLTLAVLAGAMSAPA